MMNQLTKHNLFEISFLTVFKLYLIIFLCMFTIKAYSDNKTSIEFVSSPITEKTNVRVSQLTKPSLGSLGIKTEINDFMGLDRSN